jgi:hypothetical protein
MTEHTATTGTEVSEFIDNDMYRKKTMYGSKSPSDTTGEQNAKIHAKVAYWKEQSSSKVTVEINPRLIERQNHIFELNRKG